MPPSVMDGRYPGFARGYGSAGYPHPGFPYSGYGPYNAAPTDPADPFYAPAFFRGPAMMPPECYPSAASEPAPEPEPKARRIDGKVISAAIKEEIKEEVQKLMAEHNLQPGLACMIVGERKDSQSYVKSKKKTAGELGFHSVDVALPADVTQEVVLAEVKKLNDDPAVHGILVQLPLPDHIDEEIILAAISLEKDADGFSPVNMGRLCMKGKLKPTAVPCTPKGCIEMLDRMGVEIEGKKAVVLGRSNIVGIPVAHLLLHRNATVTICHSRTKDLPSVVREADILVAAVGRAEMVRGDWIKPGAVVIDVGINSKDDPSKKAGYRLVGDCNMKEMFQVASMATPVPGGVGPMTIAMLMKNTVELAKASKGIA